MPCFEAIPQKTVPTTLTIGGAFVLHSEAMQKMAPTTSYS